MTPGPQLAVPRVQSSTTSAALQPLAGSQPDREPRPCMTGFSNPTLWARTLKAHMYQVPTLRHVSSFDGGDARHSSDAQLPRIQPPNPNGRSPRGHPRCTVRVPRSPPPGGCVYSYPLGRSLQGYRQDSSTHPSLRQVGSGHGTQTLCLHRMRLYPRRLLPRGSPRLDSVPVLQALRLLFTHLEILLKPQVSSGFTRVLDFDLTRR